MSKHKIVVLVFVVACALAVAGSVVVFLWFVGNAESTGLVPKTLDLWTMANLVNFILYSIFWELLLVGVPLAVAGAAGWLWWRKLPDEERKMYGTLGKSNGATRGGGGLGLFFFIAFCIKVCLDGNWHVAIGSWTVDYVVGSMVLILEWVVVIFGIPLAIGLAWWMRER